jgi:hypothetical protein
MMVECVGIRVYEGRMRPYWTKTALLLALLWGVIGGAIWIVRKNRATPERIAEFVGANTLEGKAPADRAKLIEEVAKRVNSLEYEQRREMDKQRKLEKFWLALTTEEKGRYLDRELPSGFKQMMEKRMMQKPLERLLHASFLTMTATSVVMAAAEGPGPALVVTEATTALLRRIRTATKGSAVPATSTRATVNMLRSAGERMTGRGGGLGLITTLRLREARLPAESTAANRTRCTPGGSATMFHRVLKGEVVDVATSTSST